MDSSVNEQFINAVKHLKASGTIAKFAELAGELGCSAQVMSEILNGRMKVQVEMLQNIFIKYRISYDYIFKASGPIILSYEVNEPEQVYNTQCKLCLQKDKMISILEENVSLYKYKVKMLTDTINAMKNNGTKEDISKTA